MGLIFYLTKVSVCMALGYLPYHFLFRKYTFFAVNRGYILLTLIVSLTIPALHIKLKDPSPIFSKASAKQFGWTNTDGNAGTGFMFKTATRQQTATHWTVWFQGIYWTLTIALGVRLLFTLLSLIYKATNNGSTINGMHYIPNTKGQNSSFFNLIFLDLSGLTEAEGKQVITHEQLHYRLLHSVDNLFLELCKVFFWFNPFIYLFAKELRQTHEFQVDQFITADDGKISYGNLLVKLCIPVQKTLTNQFSSGELRGRINMLIRSRSAKSRQLNYLPAIALLAILGCSMSLEQVRAGIGNTAKRDFDSLKFIKRLKQNIITGPVVTKTNKALSGLKNQSELQGTADENLVPLKINQKPIQVLFSARDSVITDRKNNLLLLYGTAELSVNKTKIIADYIKYDHALSTVYAKGVHQYTGMINSDDKILVDSLIMNIKTRKVILYNYSAH